MPFVANSTEPGRGGGGGGGGGEYGGQPASQLGSVSTSRMTSGISTVRPNLPSRVRALLVCPCGHNRAYILVCVLVPCFVCLRALGFRELRTRACAHVRMCVRVCVCVCVCVCLVVLVVVLSPPVPRTHTCQRTSVRHAGPSSEGRHTNRRGGGAAKTKSVPFAELLRRKAAAPPRRRETPFSLG